MVWVGSFVTGTANDAFFMALPIVDNFWQVGKKDSGLHNTKYNA